jgi:hypothetical protein
MSLLARVKRLERMWRRDETNDTVNWFWLKAHHPDTLQRYGQLWQLHRGNQEAALRELSVEDLDNLIDACDPERRAERARWLGMVERIRPLVGPDDIRAIEEFFRHRFSLNPKEWQVPVVTFRWLTACPAALRGAAVLALKGNQTFGPTPWLELWIGLLARLTSRLPPDVSSQSIQTLAEHHIANAAKADRGSWWDTRSCDQCGLLRPVSLPACLHCGSTSCSWSIAHIVQGREWRRLAESELASFGWGIPSGSEPADLERKPKRQRRI